MTPSADDQTARLARFRIAHPRVIVLSKAAVPEAYPVLGEPPIQRTTVRELLDYLEEIFPLRG